MSAWRRYASLRALDAVIDEACAASGGVLTPQAYASVIDALIRQQFPKPLSGGRAVRVRELVERHTEQHGASGFDKAQTRACWCGLP